jgi:hypothetical protein
MVNKRFWLGILVMVLVFGMTVIGCDNGTTDGLTIDSSLNGTWDNIKEDTEYSWYYVLRLDDGNFEYFRRDNRLISKGKYSTSNGKITMEYTHLHGNTFLMYDTYNGVELSKDGIELKWYSKKDLETLGVYSTEDIMALFSGYIYNYSVNSNMLTFTHDDGYTADYIRK